MIINSLQSSKLQIYQDQSPQQLQTDLHEDVLIAFYESKFDEDSQQKAYDLKTLFNMLVSENKFKPFPQVESESPNSYLKLKLLTLKYVEIMLLETEMSSQAYLDFIVLCAYNLSLKCYDFTKNFPDIYFWIEKKPEDTRQYWINEIFQFENFIFEKSNWNLDQITICNFINFFLDNHFSEILLDQVNEEYIQDCVIECFLQFKWSAFSIAVACLTFWFQNYWEDNDNSNYLEFLIIKYNKIFKYQDQNLLISEIQEIIQYLSQQLEQNSVFDIDDQIVIQRQDQTKLNNNNNQEHSQSYQQTPQQTHQFNIEHKNIQTKEIKNQIDEIQLEAEEDLNDDVNIINQNSINKNNKTDSYKDNINKKRTFNESQTNNRYTTEFENTEIKIRDLRKSFCSDTTCYSNSQNVQSPVYEDLHDDLFGEQQDNQQIQINLKKKIKTNMNFEKNQILIIKE